jgi:hypothetical protein
VKPAANPTPENPEFDPGVYPRGCFPGPLFLEPKPNLNQLYRTTIILWSELDPTDCGLPDLMHDAVYSQSGDNILGQHSIQHVPAKNAPPHVSTYFFGTENN